MSYDLMVFNAKDAPVNRDSFMEWYDVQTQWTEQHGYNDPVNTSNELQQWFFEMIQSFPAMNGPFAAGDDDNECISDYTIGRSMIYITFSWTQAEAAYRLTKLLAEKYKVGFFDVSATDGDIIIPDMK